MILGDAGSSWCKVFTTGDEAVRLLSTAEMARGDMAFDWGTGHTARRRSQHFENDLITLSRGALEIVDQADFAVLDLGSRDAKLVGFDGRRPTKLDWSVGCAAATGATLEMLGRFYELDLDAIPAVDEWTPVTCGTFAIERIMDALTAGEPVAQAVGRFVHGLARNAHAFAGRPERLYLSGGFTLNRPFLAALERYCEVVPIGRAAPLCGLWALAADKDPSLGPIPDPIRNSVLRDNA
jgi:activator of 2-hydroxyglutaryl-CoA dehydratase